MTNDEFEGKWPLVKDQAKTWWNKLSDADLEQVGGKFENLLGLMQQRYGYTRERVEKEFSGRVAKYEAYRKKSASPAA